MKYADLHIHTNASDGLLSPEEVIWWANKIKLKAISITDHDTINGVAKAINSNINKDTPEIVPGIELNSDFYGEEVHVLGYYIDYTDVGFLNKLKEIQQSRYTRAINIIKKLKGLNINISTEQVFNASKGESIGRPHIARILVEKGYANDVKDAFNKYIGIDSPAYVERYKLTTKQAVSIINNVGGIPVLAHPGLLKKKTVINELLEQGFKGIEVYHSKHDKKITNQLLEIAINKNLIITGGSDCHGKPINGVPELGTVTIDYESFLKLKNAVKVNNL